MTKFETKAVDRITNADSLARAEFEGAYACDLCARFGRHCNCDQCAVQVAMDIVRTAYGTPEKR